MQCQICLESYNNQAHKPFIINPCGHYFCAKCLDGLFLINGVKLCPVCRVKIESTVINRAILDMMNNDSTVSNRTTSVAEKNFFLTSFDEMSIKR